MPAGTFNAFRIEARGYQTGQSGQESINVAWDWKTWYAPDAVRRPVLAEWFNKGSGGKIIRAERQELVEYRQS